MEETVGITSKIRVKLPAGHTPAESGSLRAISARPTPSHARAPMWARLMAAFASTLAAILIFAGLSLGSASAIGPDPLSGSLAPSLNPPVTPIGPSSAPQASIEAAANVCAIHTWLDPDGGVVRVRMIQGSTVITSPTWIGVLDFGGGDIAYAYCTDIAHHAAGSRPYCLDPGFFSDWRVEWLVTTYPPPLAIAFNKLPGKPLYGT